MSCNYTLAVNLEGDQVSDDNEYTRIQEYISYCHQEEFSTKLRIIILRSLNFYGQSGHENWTVLLYRNGFASSCSMAKVISRLQRWVKANIFVITYWGNSFTGEISHWWNWSGSTTTVCEY